MGEALYWLSSPPSFLLRGRHLDEVTHFVQHATNGRGVREPDTLLMVLKTKRPKRPPHGLRMTDPGANLLDVENACLVLGRDGGSVVSGTLPADCGIAS